MKFKATLIILTLLPLANQSHADSLYNPNPVVRTASLTQQGPNAITYAKPAINYFSDQKARSIGDIINVIVSENASGSSTAATKSTKTETSNVNSGVGSIFNWLRQFGLSDNGSTDASGSTSRSDTLTATIEVTVKDVLLNGNLVVEGTRTVGTNSEAQTLTLKGIIRPEDISASNTVQSSQIYDANISYGGKGTVSDKQHDGFITRLFRSIF